MTKIKEIWARLKAALGSAPKSGQGKAFVRVIQFFAVMLVLTIFARGASGATMPRVTSAAPYGTEIVESIDTTGSVSAQGSVDIELPAGLTVKRIVTGEGSTIKEGAALLEFDMEALADKIESEQMILRGLELELREMQLPGETDKTVETAQKALDKAQSSYNEASSEANKARDAYNAAVNRHADEFAAFERARDAYDRAVEEEQQKPEDERDEARLAALLDEREAAYTAQELAWGDVDSTAMENTSAQSARDMAAELLADAQEALNDAREAAAKNAQTQAIADEKNKIDIEKKETEIEKQKELIKTLESAQSAEGTVLSPSEGVVSQLPLQEGEETGEKSVIRITTSDEGFYVECMVDQKQAGEIKVGDNLSVKKPNYYYSSDAPVISKTVPNAEGMVTLRASLPGPEWEAGESLEIQVVTKRQHYGYCVPLSAIHSSGDTSYVYVLREENTILGEQTVARRVDVSVLAQDRTSAAIDGAVYGERILVSSSKPVNEGDRVRLESSGSES